MSHYPLSIRQLIRHLCYLPGIGPKTAERLAMYILRMPGKDAGAIADSIREVKEKVRLCKKCFALSDREVCDICMDPSRDSFLLCVVEQPSEMTAIERSGGFCGRYHILQGALSPMDGIGPDDIRISELVKRIPGEGIREVVLATGTNVEGEATASYIAERLASLPVRVTRIATGVPMGGDLKYVDQVTLKRAMETRHDW